MCTFKETIPSQHTHRQLPKKNLRGGWVGVQLLDQVQGVLGGQGQAAGAPAEGGQAPAAGGGVRLPYLCAWRLWIGLEPAAE